VGAKEGFVTTQIDPPLVEIRQAAAALCAKFPGEYWRRADSARAYPTEFVAALIPEAYGGSGLGLAAAAAILEEIH
jgi:acyl-CoA dehydrogenase